MIRLLAQTLTVLALMAGVVAAFAWGLYVWTTPIVIDASPTKVAPKPVRHEIGELAQIPISEFSQTLVRPLFFEGRRFPVPQPKEAKREPQKALAAPSPPPPPPKPVTLPSKIKLLGVVQLSEDWQALIEIPPQAPQWFKVGDMISEWTIARVENNEVLLTHSARSATLPLYSDGASK
ncbi:MAG TPA: hypothetical protein VG758_14705 [Hyphomicrobiaceae bacterium]|jgi:hypothetical protein|nr:hypothetical protein [Hyphomicrobiaceae bacterium]